MSDWLDTAALEFVKQSAARTTVMGSQPQKSGFGSTMSRMGSPGGIAPSPRPVRNPQTRATPKPPSPMMPRTGKAVTLPRSMPMPAPPKLKTSSVASAFFRGVKGLPGFLFRATPTPVKVVGGLSLAGAGAGVAGSKVVRHTRGVQADRLAKLPSVRQKQELYDTFRYGAPRAT